MKKFIKLFLIMLFSFSISSMSFSSENYQKEMLNLVNIQRKKANISPLILDEKLNKLAKIKVDLVIKEGKLNHYAGGYNSLGEFLKNYGISYLAVGENLATKTKNPEDTMNLWMNSKGHRANILNKNFKNIGISRGIDKEGNIYWVQIFTNPR